MSDDIEQEKQALQHIAIPILYIAYVDTSQCTSEFYKTQQTSGDRVC